MCRELIDSFADLRQSISFTTRQIRDGEQDGIDYHFVDQVAFRQMVTENKLAELAQVHGNMYGTSLATLEQGAAEGIDLLLDIDCQGAAQLKKNYRQGVFVFILPPDLTELERRLRGRGTDSEAVIKRRLDNSAEEISQASWYDYHIVNDDFQTALQQLTSIVIAERCRADRNPALLEK